MKDCYAEKALTIIMNLICASIVTRDCLLEFILLYKSLTRFHECSWYLICDEHSARYLSQIDCIRVVDIHKRESSSHGCSNGDLNNAHMRLMMRKFDACQAALNEHEHVLFLDADIFFLAPFDATIYQNIISPAGVDAIVSPHYSLDPKLETEVGRFNGGMFVLKNRYLLQSWRDLSARYKDLNYYYEQQPLEFIAEDFYVSCFPITYNMGWWRLNSQASIQRLSSFALLECGSVGFKNKQLVSCHLHVYKDLDYPNYGLCLYKLVMHLLSRSGSQRSSELLSIIKDLNVAKKLGIIPDVSLLAHA